MPMSYMEFYLMQMNTTLDGRSNHPASRQCDSMLMTLNDVQVSIFMVVNPTLLRASIRWRSKSCFTTTITQYLYRLYTDLLPRDPIWATSRRGLKTRTATIPLCLIPTPRLATAISPRSPQAQISLRRHYYMRIIRHHTTKYSPEDRVFMNPYQKCHDASPWYPRGTMWYLPSDSAILPTLNT